MIDLETMRKRDRDRKRKRMQRPEQKQRMAAYMREFNRRPDQVEKIKARRAANRALKSGRLVRPKRCEICGVIPAPLLDGRSGLRMDHHKGHDRANWLNVQFICVSCDGKQLRKK